MKVALRISIILLLSCAAFSQTTKIRSVTSLPATCAPGDGVNPADIVALASGGTTSFEICRVTNTWAPLVPDPGSNGVIFRSALNTTRVSTSTDIISLWTGSCNANTVLFGDGSCGNSGVQTPACPGLLPVAYFPNGSTASIQGDCLFTTDGSGNVSLKSITGSGTGTTVYTGTAGTAPSVPGGASQFSLFVDSGTSTLNCLLHSGASCLPASAVTSVFGRTGAVVAVAGDYTFDKIAAGSNLNTLTMGNAGSLKPVNLGQIAGNQAWLQPGIIAPTLTAGATSSGSLTSNHGVNVQVVLNVGAGQTLGSVSAGINTNAAGCVSNCSVTVTAPTIPSGYSGYTVYACDVNASQTCSTAVTLVQISGCVNITTNCVITTAPSNASPVVPTINTAIIQPTNIQAASLVPPGSAPSLYYPAVDGNYRPLAGMDFSSGGSLPSPDGTFEFWHRLFVNDTGLSLGTSTGTNGLIKNALFSISHVSGATTSTGSTTDDRVFAFRGVDSLTSPTYEQWLGIYGEQLVQNANFTCSPIGGGAGAGEDCIAAIRARANMSVHTTTNATGLVGIHGVASTAVSNPNFGSCTPCVVGVIGSADQEVISNQNAPIFYAGVMGIISAFGTPTGGSGWGLLSNLGTRFSSQNGGLLIKSSFSSANAADYAILSEASARSVWLGPQYFTKWGTNLGTLSVVGSIAQTGSFGTSQLVTPTFANGNITPIGTTGATTYTYKVVAIDGNGAAVAASATGTTSTGNTTLDGTNKNRITVNVCNGLSGSSADMLGYSGINVYRTVGGATQGKIGSLTLTAQGDQTAFTTCNITFDDTGLAGDASTAPTVNTTGGVNVAGDITLTSGKGQHVNTQAANNDFAGTCTASAATTCTVTFTRAYTAAPICTATDASNITTLKVTPGTGALVITTTGSTSDVFNYICVGNPN